MAITCPDCGLVNPDDAPSCDCGHPLRASVDEQGETAPRRRPRPPLGAARGFLIFVVFAASMFVAALIVAVVLTVAVFVSDPAQMRAGPGGGPAVPAVVLVVSILVGELVAVVPVFFIARYSLPALLRDRSPVGIGMRLGPRRQLLLAGLSGLGLAALCIVVTRLFPPDASHLSNPLVRAALEGGAARHLWAVVMLLVAPGGEEFVFRGVLFKAFSRSWGVTTAALITTALFAVCHATTYWPTMALVFLGGLVMVRYRIRTGALGPAVMVHFCYNATLVLLVYLSRAW
jgi:membrane protease YdiL (CAAX protease family)